MALEIVRVGRYRARFASSQNDVSSAQALRYECFNLSNKIELDVDDFDTICQHVLIENLETQKLICCYRILSFENGKKIDSKNISKLINLSENHSISELVDNCLAKNKKKIINILNENNFSNEDCIMIIRSFIMKAKKLLVLSKTFETNKNIDLTISSAKPPIFWKEKEITKQQIQKWKPKNIKNLIYALSETELQIKKNINNSINLITDFIISQSLSEANS